MRSNGSTGGSLDTWSYLILIAVGAVAGFTNVMAGGGSLLTMPDTLVSRDGVELEYRVFHVPPGILSGDEMLLELATAERGGMWLILDAGLSYGRSPDGSLYGQPAVHATLAQIVGRLNLGELLS